MKCNKLIFLAYKIVNLAFDGVKVGKKRHRSTKGHAVFRDGLMRQSQQVKTTLTFTLNNIIIKPRISSSLISYSSAFELEEGTRNLSE
jgi:hypothetical protein